jgi:2-oxoglutarate ferredoxin oxidoreductase subunit beta
MPRKFEHTHNVAWCPGCGNFPIRVALMGALEELGRRNQDLVMVSGIGQAAKMPQYIESSFFNDLHGRGLPSAVGIKASNPSLLVIAEGVFEAPLNPVALAIGMNASFVARVLAGDLERTKEIMKAAILHKGFSIVDIFQPCVTFNEHNTMKWFRDNSYWLEEGYAPGNRAAAFARAIEEEPFPLGILYRVEGRPSFEENQRLYRNDPRPLRLRSTPPGMMRELIREREG